MASSHPPQDHDYSDYTRECTRPIARRSASCPPRFTPAPALGADSALHARPARQVISHILLIEHDGDVREALTGVLRMHRWRVTAVARPAEVYASLSSTDMPDVILIDSPHPDSITQFLQHVGAAALGQVPIIAMVASDHTPVGPVVRVLKKPFEIGSLLTLISNLD